MSDREMFRNTTFVPKEQKAARRKKSLQPYKLALPDFGPVDLASETIICHLRNVTDEYDRLGAGTPLYLVNGPTIALIQGQAPIANHMTVLPSQVVGVEERHWPEVSAMLSKHAKSGLRYFEITEDPTETAQEVYERLAAEDPERALAMDQAAAGGN